MAGKFCLLLFQQSAVTACLHPAAALCTACHHHCFQDLLTAPTVTELHCLLLLLLLVLLIETCCALGPHPHRIFGVSLFRGRQHQQGAICVQAVMVRRQHQLHGQWPDTAAACRNTLQGKRSCMPDQVCACKSAACYRAVARHCSCLQQFAARQGVTERLVRRLLLCGASACGLHASASGLPVHLVCMRRGVA
jgi:hypothetical protein